MQIECLHDNISETFSYFVLSWTSLRVLVGPRALELEREVEGELQGELKRGSPDLSHT